MRVKTVWLCVMAFLTILPAHGAETNGVPDSITYQGKLNNLLGVPASDGAYQMQFKLYNCESGGEPVWTSPIINVVTVGGMFTAKISGVPPSVFADRLWLETIIGSQTLSPRAELTSVPYAIRAGSLALPFVGSVMSADSAFTIINTGTGLAAEFQGNVSVNGKFSIEGSTLSSAFEVKGSSKLDGDVEVTGDVVVAEGKKVDGLDISEHNHSGPGQGGTIKWASTVPRCLRVDHINQADKFGGQTEIAHTTNGVVGVYADWSAFASAAAHEIMATVNGKRVITCGPDYAIGSPPQLLGASNNPISWNGFGPAMWHLVTGIWWQDAQGNQIEPAALTELDTQVTMCRDVLVGWKSGTNGRDFSYVTDAAVMVKLEDMHGRIIDDPTNDYTPDEYERSISLCQNGKPAMLLVPVRYDSDIEAPVVLKLHVKSASLVGQPAYIRISPFPGGMWSPNNYVYSLQVSKWSTQVRVDSTGPSWYSTVIDPGRLKKGINMLLITANCENPGQNINLGVTPASPNPGSVITTNTNHAMYAWTENGTYYDGLMVVRYEATVYRDHDYIDVQVKVPPVGPETMWGTGLSYPMLNFAQLGEGGFRGIVPTERSKLGRKYPITWNRIQKPDGTVITNPVAPIHGADFGLNKEWWFWHESEDGTVRWKWGIEAVEEGTPGKTYSVIDFGRFTSLPYYRLEDLAAKNLFNDIYVRGDPNQMGLANGESNKKIRLHLENLVGAF